MKIAAWFGTVLLVASTACGSSAGGDEGGEAEGALRGFKAVDVVYYADLGPSGTQWYARSGSKRAKLLVERGANLVGNEDGPGTGTVKEGGEGCDECLFLKNPRTRKWVEVGRSNGSELSLDDGRVSFAASGYKLSGDIVRAFVADDDPEYGKLTVKW